MNNNLLLGFAGGAFSGKDTANLIIQNELYENFRTDADKLSTRIYYKIANNNYSLIQESEADAFLIATLVPLSNGQQLNLFNAPLANEVKREFIVEMAQNGVKIDFERLLADSAYKAQYREHLIEIGDGRREKIDKSYWLDKINSLISCLSERYSDPEINFNIYSITDMRYKNEPEHQEQYYRNIMPTFTTKIECDIHKAIMRMTDEQAYDYVRKHYHNPSEKNTKHLKGDFNIDNNDTIDTLKTQLTTKVVPVISRLIDNWKKEGQNG